MLAFTVGGLAVPDAGPVFFAALAAHVLAAGTAVVAGAVAAIAGKRPGRHPRSGRVYLRALGGVFVTATVLAAIRWREDAYLFAIAAVAYSLGLAGARAWRRESVRWHAIGTGGSYIALLTGFYVDNGPRLPLWRVLPHWLLWAGPAAVGVPLIWWGLRRFRAGIRVLPRAVVRSGG
jgi:hypothetical protein